MIAAALALTLAQSPDLSKFVYPFARAIPAPTITVDTTDAPEAKEWAVAAQKLATEWFPVITSLLATEKYKPSREIRLVFKKDLNVPAYASGNEITISAKWVRERPNDLGLVVHEVTHLVQAYPNNRHNTGWLVEGIADYVRWWRYEPEAPRSRIDFTKATFRDSYRTTAWFLAFASDKYNRGLVPALDRALREAKDPMPLFQELTGKTAEDLWKEFAESRR